MTDLEATPHRPRTEMTAVELLHYLEFIAKLGGAPLNATPQQRERIERAADASAPTYRATPPELQEVLREVERATHKFPTWPTDPLHALAVLGEEFGELTKAMLQLTYEPQKTTADEVRNEAVQTAAMALRLIASLGTYEYRPAHQHVQRAPA